MILTKTLQCSHGVFGSFCLRLMSQKEKRRRETHKLNSHSGRHKNEAPSRLSALLFEPRDERRVATPVRRSKHPCLLVGQRNGPCGNARSDCGDELAEQNQNDRDLLRTHGFLPLLTVPTIARDSHIFGGGRAADLIRHCSLKRRPSDSAQTRRISAAMCRVGPLLARSMRRSTESRVLISFGCLSHRMKAAASSSVITTTSPLSFNGGSNWNLAIVASRTASVRLMASKAGAHHSMLTRTPS